MLYFAGGVRRCVSFCCKMEIRGCHFSRGSFCARLERITRRIIAAATAAFCLKDPPSLSRSSYVYTSTKCSSGSVRYLSNTLWMMGLSPVDSLGVRISCFDISGGIFRV